MQVKKHQLELDMEQWFPAMAGNPLVLPPDQALSPSARIPDGVCDPVYYHSSVQVWAWFPVETRASITGIFPKHRVRINVVSKCANEHFFKTHTHKKKIGKGIRQGCILSPCLFNFYAEYIMWNAGLVESQAGIKIAKRNINNLRYAHNTTLMAESEKELNSLLMRVKEESGKAGLKLNI